MVRVRLLPYDPRKGQLRQRAGVAGIGGTFEAGVWRKIKPEQVPLLDLVTQPNGKRAWEIEEPAAAPAKDAPAPAAAKPPSVDAAANLRQHIREDLGVEPPAGQEGPAPGAETGASSDAASSGEPAADGAAPKRPRRVRGVA